MLTCFSYDSMQSQIAYCSVYACEGSSLVFSGCALAGGICNGDTIFKLYNSTGDFIASNDDYCGYCSRVSYTTTGGCQTYTLLQGCASDKPCSGTTVVTGALSLVASPTYSPTYTILPSISPSTAPSVTPTSSYSTLALTRTAR